MIGILGGTFNPVHHGHLRLALSVYQQLQLDQVHLILSARPPHKNEPHASTEQRWQMLQAAVANEPSLIADDREIHRSGLSYTIDTLADLKQTSGQNLALILGSDALNGLMGWHQWQKLLDLCHIIVVKRPQQVLKLPTVLEHYLNPKQAHSPQMLRQQSTGLWYQMTMWPPPIPVSATMIRNLVQNNQNARYLLPEAVLALIDSYGLYKA